MPVWYHPPPVLVPGPPLLPGQQAPAPMYHYPPPICIDPSPDARVPPGAPTMPSAPFPAPPIPPQAAQPFPGGVADPAQNNFPSPPPPPPAHGNGTNNTRHPSQHVPSAYPPPPLGNTHVVAAPPEGNSAPLGGPITTPREVCRCYNSCEGKHSPLGQANYERQARSEMFDIPAEPPLRRSVALPRQSQTRDSPSYYVDQHGHKISIPPNYGSGHDSLAHRHRQTRHVEFTTDESGGFAVELTHGCGSCGKGFRMASGSGVIATGSDGLGGPGRRSCDQCLANEVADEQAKNDLQVRQGEEERLKNAKLKEAKKELMRKEIRAEIEREYAEKLEAEKALKLQAEESARKEALLRLANEEVERKRIHKEVEIEIERRRLEQARIEEEAKRMEIERTRMRKQAELEHERKRKEDELKALEAFKQMELDKEVERRMKNEDERAQKEQEEKILREAEERRKVEARNKLREKIKRDLMEEEAQKIETARIASQAAKLKELEVHRLRNAQDKSDMEAERDVLRLKIRRELEVEERARLSFERMEKLSLDQERLRLLEKTLAEHAVRDVIRQEEYLKMKEEAELKAQVLSSQERALEKAKVRQQLIKEAAAAQFAKEAHRAVDNGNKPEWKEGQCIDEAQLLQRLGGNSNSSTPLDIHKPPSLLANPPLPAPPSVISPGAGLGHFSNSPLRDTPSKMFTNSPHASGAGAPPPPPHVDKVNLQWETNYKDGHYDSKQWNR
ncbi:hypothetical protein HOY82DRAFT_647972 [Tuber indicum]|nr:hypothetical protein HOY82DRAFT_647972 [Tuber indicum]